MVKEKKDQANTTSPNAKVVTSGIAKSASLPEVVITKAPSARASGQLWDLKLKPLILSNYQPTLLSTVEGEKPESDNQGPRLICEGIELSEAEHRLTTALTLLLKEKSEYKDEDSKDFYLGNNNQGEVMKWGSESILVPIIKIAPSEIYKAYTGNNDYSGRDIIQIDKTLKDLANTKRLVRYKRERIISKNGKPHTVVDIIEKDIPLIDITYLFEGVSKEEEALIEQGDIATRKNKGEISIKLHPIFNDQIKDKYVLVPMDIIPRLNEASGGGRSHKATTIFNDYLLKEKSVRRPNYTSTINKENLITLLHLTKLKQQRKKAEIEVRIQHAIDTSIKLGLLLKYDLVIGAEGQEKYVFIVNKDFA